MSQTEQHFESWYESGSTGLYGQRCVGNFLNSAGIYTCTCTYNHKQQHFEPVELNCIAWSRMCRKFSTLCDFQAVKTKEDNFSYFRLLLVFNSDDVMYMYIHRTCSKYLNSPVQ